MVLQVGASKFGPAGGAKSMVNPLTVGMIGASALGNIFGGQNVAGVSSDDLDALMDRIRQLGGQAQGEARRPVSVGGTSFSVGPEPRERKQAALVDFLINEKGLSPDKARERASKIMKPGGKKPNQVKGFSNFIEEQGDRYNLSLKGKKITGPAGEIQFQAPTDPLQNMSAALNQQVMGSAFGLPQAFADQARQGLNFQSQIRRALANQFGRGGLTPELAADVQDIMDIQNQALRGVVGNLSESGFLSSSLTGKKIREDIEPLQERLYGDLLSKSQGLRSQNIRDLLSSAQTLGGPQSFGQFIQGGFTSPEEFGGFTSPQAARFGQQERAFQAGIPLKQAGLEAQVGTTPTFEEDSGGFLGIF